MARLPYRNAAEVDEEHRELLARDINLYRAMIHSPEGTRHFQAFANWIRFGSKLDSRLREMAILQVGYLLSNAYEYSHHVEISQRFGVTECDLAAICGETSGRDSGLPSLDRTILRAAREMTSGLRIEAGTFDLLRAELDDELLVELVLIVSFYNGVVRFLETLQIDVEPAYIPFSAGLAGSTALRGS